MARYLRMIKLRIIILQVKTYIRTKKKKKLSIVKSYRVSFACLYWAGKTLCFLQISYR